VGVNSGVRADRYETPVRVRRRRLSEPSFAFLLNAPALLAIVGLVGYPIAYSLWLSLHRYNLKRPSLFRFIGFGNYVEILGSDEFWRRSRSFSLTRRS